MWRRIHRRNIRTTRRRKVGDAHVTPRRAVVTRDMNEPVVRAHPEQSGHRGRCRQRFNRPPTTQRRGGGDGVHPRRNGQLGADARPVRTAVERLRDVVEPHQQQARIPRRPHQRLRRGGAHFRRRIHRRADVDPLFARIAHAHDAVAAGKDIQRIDRIGHNGAPLPSIHRIPIEHRDGAVVAAHARSDRARVLLRGVHPVRVRVVHREVIQLLGGLIVP